MLLIAMQYFENPQFGLVRVLVQYSLSFSISLVPRLYLCLPTLEELGDLHSRVDRRRSQWPRSVRHELSSLARMLGSWVRIPLKACLYAFILCLLSWVKVAALRRADPRSNKSYRLCKKKRLRNCRRVQGPTKDCRAIDEWLNEWMNIK
jgi:hypothetical protein